MHCLSQRMVASLEKAIQNERLVADDSEDYLLHVFGGRLSEQADRARLSVDEFAHQLYAYAADTKARTKAMRERQAAREAEREAEAAYKKASIGNERQGASWQLATAAYCKDRA